MKRFFIECLILYFSFVLAYFFPILNNNIFQFDGVTFSFVQGIAPFVFLGR